MKKIAVIILSLLFTVLFAGCGTYIPETGSSNRPSFGNNGGNHGGNNGDKPGGEDGPGGDKEYVFTVTLENAPAVLPEDMEATWSKRNEVHSAKFVDGVASITGLNGEYRVTLSSLPNGYTYDCNAYEINNNERDAVIKLIKIIPVKTNDLSHNGKDEYKGYQIYDYGTYRATLTSASSKIYYEFHPRENGVFFITSMVDVTANNINPIIEVWGGNSSFRHFPVDYDDGGVSNTFTKNFRYSSAFANENLSDATDLAFSVRAKVNNVSYPVIVDFTISREGDFELEDTKGEPVYATGPYATKEQQNSTGSWTYIYEENTSVFGGVTYYIQDETKVVFNETDGYYHVGTANGPLLYARLIQDCQMLITVALPGGSWVNKGFFWNELDNGMVNLNCYGYNYSQMINNGYAKYCDSTGSHPVNKQIRDFLWAFASNKGYFRDGEGIAEDPELNQNDYNNPGMNIQSDENSMWMFACGYYKK